MSRSDSPLSSQGRVEIGASWYRILFLDGLVVHVRAAKRVKRVIRRKLPRHVLEVVLARRLEARRQRIEARGLRREVPVSRVRSPHDQRQRAESGVVQLVLVDERVERALLAVMPQLHVWDVIGYRLLALGDLHDVAGGDEEKHGVAIHEPADEPWTRDAVDTRFFPSHPFHGVLLFTWMQRRSFRYAPAGRRARAPPAAYQAETPPRI